MPTPFPSRLRGLRPAAAAGLFLLAQGCSLFFEKPDVRIARVDIVSVGLTGATAAIELEVVNPNGYDLRAREVRYALEFQEGGDWRTVARSEAGRELTVAAGDTVLVALDVPFRYQDVGSAVLSLLQQGRLDYRVRGDVRFAAPVGSVRVPFDRQGTIDP